MQQIFCTVIEYTHYLNKTKKLLTEEQTREIADIVARTPEIGEILKGTGGIRKFRYAAHEGKGKSSGARVIYFYISEDETVHLLDIFPKNEKENLSQADRNELFKLTQILKG